MICTSKEFIFRSKPSGFGHHAVVYGNDGKVTIGYSSCGDLMQMTPDQFFELLDTMHGARILVYSMREKTRGSERRDDDPWCVWRTEDSIWLPVMPLSSWEHVTITPEMEYGGLLVVSAGSDGWHGAFPCTFMDRDFE